MASGDGSCTVVLPLPANVKLTVVADGPVQSAVLAATGKVEGPRLGTADGASHLHARGAAVETRAVSATIEGQRDILPWHPEPWKRKEFRGAKRGRELRGTAHESRHVAHAGIAPHLGVGHEPDADGRHENRLRADVLHFESYRFLHAEESQET